MIGPRGFMARLERAAEAFLTEPHTITPGCVGTLRRTVQRVEHPLTEAERSYLADRALSLLDPDVRGWVIVTIREHRGSADIDADVHIPAGTGPGVDCVLSEALA